MTLSIIILSWNTLNLTRDCLRSIFNNYGAITAERSERLDNVKDLDYEVIVVDNASSDGSAEMIGKEFPQVKLIKNKENAGFARGNNQGFRESRGEYVLFLNSDTIMPQPKTTGSALVVMIKAMQIDKKIGALAPKLVYPNGKFQYEFYRKFPSLSQTFWLYLLPMSKLTYRVNSLRKRYLTDINPEKSSFVENINLPGTALLMPAKLCRELNGWDEGTFYWLEDVDLNLRIKKAGYKLYYFADAEIIHLGGASSALWDDFKKMYNFRKSYLYYFRKHKGGLQAFLVKWLFILNALFTAPFLIILGIFKRRFWKKGIAALKFSWKFLDT